MLSESALNYVSTISLDSSVNTGFLIYCIAVTCVRISISMVVSVSVISILDTGIGLSLLPTCSSKSLNYKDNANYNST